MRSAPRFQVATTPSLVELEDRVVHHRLDKVAEPALALEQPTLLEPLGYVAGDLRETDELAVAVTYGVDHRQRPEPTAIGAPPPALRFEPASPRRRGERLL